MELTKTNHDYDFFYRQDVIKPALVGLAGPWISGGVEFNWPEASRQSPTEKKKRALEFPPEFATRAFFPASWLCLGSTEVPPEINAIGFGLAVCEAAVRRGRSTLRTRPS
jgi:hypothetical protein